MSRLPTPGSDDGTWGNILNDFLNVSMNTDGTLKGSTVTVTQLSAGTGTDGQVLTKDSTQVSGLKWTSAAGGGSATLAGDTDVAISGPAGGDVLTYNNISGKWTNLAAPVISVNTHTGVVSLTKTDIGLGNVDNTSDANKPVSTATQTALNAKANTSTTISAGSGLSGGGDLSANRTISANFGSTTGTIAQGDDSRITGAVQKSTATTKGDLLAATGAAAITRVGVGADGDVLTADSTQATGVKWTAPASSNSNLVYAMIFGGF